MHRDLFHRSCEEVFYKDVSKRYPLYRELKQRSYLEISSGDLFCGSRPRTEISQRFFCRELVRRSCTELSYSDLAKRSPIDTCTEILLRGNLQRSFAETLYRDPVQRSGIEISTIAEILTGDLLQRSTGIFQQDLVQQFCIHLLQRPCLEMTETWNKDLQEWDLLRVSCTEPTEDVA